MALQDGMGKQATFQTAKLCTQPLCLTSQLMNDVFASKGE